MMIKIWSKDTKEVLQISTEVPPLQIESIMELMWRTTSTLGWFMFSTD